MSSQPSCTGLNYSYGVNAWKCWVQSKYANGETSKGDELRFGRTYPGKEGQGRGGGGGAGGRGCGWGKGAQGCDSAEDVWQ